MAGRGWPLAHMFRHGQQRLATKQPIGPLHCLGQKPWPTMLGHRVGPLSFLKPKTHGPFVVQTRSQHLPHWLQPTLWYLEPTNMPLEDIAESEGSMSKQELQAVATRVCRALKDLDEGFQKQWHKAMKDKSIDRQEFLTTAANKFGSDLTKLMHHELIQKTSVEQETAMEGTGEWLDEEDLKVRFKDKPQQYEAILKNARRFHDKTREIELYEVPTYKSSEVSRTKRTIEESSKASVDETVKRIKFPKVQKPEGDLVTEGNGEPSATKLTRAQHSWIDKQINKLKDYNLLKEALAEFEDDANAKWTQFISPWLKVRGADCITQLETQIDELVAIKDADEAVDFKSVQKAFKKAMQDVADNRCRAEAHWELSWEMITEAEQNELLKEDETEEKEEKKQIASP